MGKMFKQTKTARGFNLLKFEDDYGLACSLQLSSSVEPHIWLGVDELNPQIQYCDANKLGLNLEKIDSTSNEYGWCKYPLPKEVLISSRMHLNKTQAKELAYKLLQFADIGNL